MLASSDQRYVKLVRFLLDGKGIGVVASVSPDAAADAVGGGPADVVVIDAGGVTEGLRIANVTRARRPETAVVLVGENAADRAPARNADLREVGGHRRRHRRDHGGCWQGRVTSEGSEHDSRRTNRSTVPAEAGLIPQHPTDSTSLMASVAAAGEKTAETRPIAGVSARPARLEEAHRALLC